MATPKKTSESQHFSLKKDRLYSTPLENKSLGKGGCVCILTNSASPEEADSCQLFPKGRFRSKPLPISLSLNLSLSSLSSPHHHILIHTDKRHSSSCFVGWPSRSWTKRALCCIQLALHQRTWAFQLLEARGIGHSNSKPSPQNSF